MWTNFIYMQSNFPKLVTFSAATNKQLSCDERAYARLKIQCLYVSETIAKRLLTGYGTQWDSTVFSRCYLSLLYFGDALCTRGDY